jgi:DNA-binding transcriptional LysR family regulator
MNLRQLRYFTVVAELSSFRKAAERLHIAQPALTRQIQDLEQQIGAPLFRRTARGVELTDLGLEVLRDGARLLGEFQQFEARIIHRRIDLDQRLSIAFHEAAAQNRCLTDSIARFKSSFPRAHLELQAMGEQDQLEALHEGRIDLFWAYDICGQFQRESSLKTHIIQRDEMVLICALDHPLAKAATAAPHALAREPLIIHDSKRSPREGFGYFVERCRAHGLPIDSAQEAINVDMLISLVSSGVGVAMVAENIRDDLRSRVAVVRVPAMELGLDLTVVWSCAHCSDLASRYLDIVRSCLEPAETP